MCSRTDTQTDSIDSIDTTTVEKLEGTSSEEDVNSFLFLLGPFPVSRYCATDVLPIPFPTPLYSPRKFTKRVWFASDIAQRKNESPLQKLEWTKYVWSLLSPKLEGTRPMGTTG